MSDSVPAPPKVPAAARYLHEEGQLHSRRRVELGTDDRETSLNSLSLVFNTYYNVLVFYLLNLFRSVL